jgi:(S)-ureidoglycine-glyoxylate aminotransferase
MAANDAALEALLVNVTGQIARVFCAGTKTGLVVPGASRAGIEAVLSSAVEPGDRVLVGAFGHFGELLCTLASRHGAVVERLDADWGIPVDARELAAAIRASRPKLVAVVHADTSTGIVQPLETIGQACNESGALFVVDAVLSLGGCELRVDDWGIDAAVGGMQKCLGGPPGLALLAVSERLLATVRARRTPPRSAYLDLHRISRQPAAAASTSMLFAAHAALGMIEAEGLQARWARHQVAGRAVAAGLQAMGLQLFGDRDHAAPMITLVRVPDGISEPGVREQLLAEHGVEIMAAFGPLRGKVWRIGCMGVNARLTSVLHVLGALEAVLTTQGWQVRRGAGVDAARSASLDSEATAAVDPNRPA